MEAKQREEMNRQKEIESQQRLEQLRRQQEKMPSHKRKASDEKDGKTELILQKFIEDRNAKTADLRRRDGAKHEKAMNFVYVAERDC